MTNYQIHDSNEYQAPRGLPPGRGGAAGPAAPVMDVPGFEQLAAVLRRAYAQAALGKGRERHANGKAFHEQPMQDLIRLNGLGFATGQACKKATEALGLAETPRAISELLGAIVYLAGAVIALERQELEQERGTAGSSLAELLRSRGAPLNDMGQQQRKSCREED